MSDIVRANYTKLTALANTIEKNIEDLTAANETASNAGSDAVTAAGGGTAVGQAVKSAILEDTNNQFGDAVKIVNSMIEAIRFVADKYKTSDENLLGHIQSIAARNSGGGAPAGGINLGNMDSNASYKAY